MKELTKIAIGLCLLACLVWSEPTVVFREVVPAVNQNVTTIVRETPIQGRYTLIVNTWAIYPDLHDRFYLAKAQRVSIFYTVTSWTPNFCVLHTKIKIDDVYNPLFNFATVANYERTHTHTHKVWLQAGWHTVAVWYWTGGSWVNQPSNDNNEIQFGLLQIEYLDFS